MAPPSSSSTGTRFATLSSFSRGGRFTGWISTSSTSTPFSANAMRTLPEYGEVRNDQMRGTMDPILRSAAYDRRDMADHVVMGIVNVTPDSFSDGGRWFRASAAI